MNDEDKIKPAEIQDEELNEASGGVRYFQQVTGIRATNVKLSNDPDTINASFTKDSVIEFQDGDDLFLRKRPGRTKF